MSRENNQGLPTDTKDWSMQVFTAIYDAKSVAPDSDLIQLYKDDVAVGDPVSISAFSAFRADAEMQLIINGNASMPKTLAAGEIWHCRARDYKFVAADVQISLM